VQVLFRAAARKRTCTEEEIRVLRKSCLVLVVFALRGKTTSTIELQTFSQL
jgi:hypothetical protein